MIKTLKKYAWNEADSDELRFSKFLILIISIVCCFCGGVWSVMYYVFLGYGLTMLLPLIFMTLVMPAIFISHYLRNYKILVYVQLLCITWVSALIQWSLGSMHNSGIVLSWSFLGPIGALLFFHTKHAKVWMFMFLSIVLISTIVEPELSNDGLRVTQSARTVFYLMNLGIPALMVFSSAFYFVKNLFEQKEKNLQLLKTSKEKTKKIEASILYAKRIQRAIMPQKDKFQTVFTDSFIFLQPKDQVSGDFYWFENFENSTKKIVIVGDCTGHGVPGAILSVLGMNSLVEILHTKEIRHSNQVLELLSKKIIQNLRQKDTGNRDSIDMGVCILDVEKKIIEFSGAKNSLIYIQDKQLYHVKGDKLTVGITGKQKKAAFFQTHNIPVHTTTYCYLFSDGFQDQFGGVRGHKFMIKRLKELLLEIHLKTMQEQKEILAITLLEWQNHNPQKIEKQIDDVLIVGFKIEN